MGTRLELLQGGVVMKDAQARIWSRWNVKRYMGILSDPTDLQQY
jgi:hypothetical protein